MRISYSLMLYISLYSISITLSYNLVVNNEFIKQKKDDNRNIENKIEINVNNQINSIRNKNMRIINSSNINYDRIIGKCNLANIEKNCELGATYCLFEDMEYCSLCKSGKMLVSPFKNVYRCVPKELTLCSNDETCQQCDENGNCVFCGNNDSKVSYEGRCVDSSKNSCEKSNCISCVNSGADCLRCKTGYLLSNSGICVENKVGCALKNSSEDFCSICHQRWIMNFDFKGCREYIGN